MQAPQGRKRSVPDIPLVVRDLVLLEEGDVLLLKRQLLVMLLRVAMYRETAGTLDSLTLKAPYPFCQANCLFHLSWTQREELVFTTRATSAAACTGRIRISM